MLSLLLLGHRSVPLRPSSNRPSADEPCAAQISVKTALWGHPRSHRLRPQVVSPTFPDGGRTDATHTARHATRRAFTAAVIGHGVRNIGYDRRARPTAVGLGQSPAPGRPSS